MAPAATIIADRPDASCQVAVALRALRLLARAQPDATALSAAIDNLLIAINAAEMEQHLQSARTLRKAMESGVRGTEREHE